MPFYVYRAKDAKKCCPVCETALEVLQKMSDPAIEKCPDCGNELAKVMQSIPTIRDDSTKKTLSDDNLKKHGFKKLVNRGGGKFDEVV